MVSIQLRAGDPSGPATVVVVGPMANPKIDLDRAAHALAEAELSGTRKACDRYGITDRTLRSYRKRLATDPELAGLFRQILGNATANLQARRARGELRWRLDTQKALASIAKRVAELALTCTDLDLLSKAFARLGEPEYTSDMLSNGGNAPKGPSEAQTDRSAPEGPEASADPPVN